MPFRNTCPHGQLKVGVSFQGSKVGFERQSFEKRKAATTSSGRITKGQAGTPEGESQDSQVYPAPLVLPGDDLAVDPKYPPQSFRAWRMGKHRNAVNKRRNRLYVVSVPEITRDVAIMKSWIDPVVHKGEGNDSPGLAKRIPTPRPEHVRDYLAAFYHGLDVVSYEDTFRWIAWESKAKGHKYVGLATGKDQCVRVGCRPSPDGVARGQLNLNDILDGLLEIVPTDAYAILLLIDHDMYEDEDDDFCCGRAYGGSRIAVASSFRYHPKLDATSGVHHDHMWPASHCGLYVAKLCGIPGGKLRGEPSSTTDSPLAAAVKAATPVLVPRTDADWAGLWTSRVARTASHELGHCLGMDHCVYYACVMQGTAGMGEDVRQPPYLCPVCEAKVSFAIAGEAVQEKNQEQEAMREYAARRDAALLAICRKWDGVGMFRGFGAWLEAKRRYLAGGID